MLKPVFGDQTCMEACPTGDNLNLLNTIKYSFCFLAKSPFHDVVSRQPPLQSIADRPWLLKDLLLHKVAIVPKLYRIFSKLAFANSSFDNTPTAIGDGIAGSINLGHIAVLKNHIISGNRQQCRHI